MGETLKGARGVTPSILDGGRLEPDGQRPGRKTSNSLTVRLCCGRPLPHERLHAGASNSGGKHETDFFKSRDVASEEPPIGCSGGGDPEGYRMLRTARAQGLRRA